MSALSARNAGRRLAEARLSVDDGGSTVVVRRPTGGTTTDPATGRLVAEWGDVHVGLAARIGSSWGASPSRTVNVADVEQRVATRTLHLPADTSDLVDGDHVLVTAGENVDTIWRIVESEWQDQATARRLPVVQVDAPEGWS